MLTGPPLVFDAQSFHLLCQGLRFFQATCKPGPLKAIQNQSLNLLHFLAHHKIQTSKNESRRKKGGKNVVDLFAGYISKNRCRFYSIIYASVVCIKEGLNYPPSRFVIFALKKQQKTTQGDGALDGSDARLQICSAVIWGNFSPPYLGACFSFLLSPTINNHFSWQPGEDIGVPKIVGSHVKNVGISENPPFSRISRSNLILRKESLDGDVENLGQRSERHTM